MSRQLALFFALAAPLGSASAQSAYGPADFDNEAQSDKPVPLSEPQRCEGKVREDGAIVVCRELVEPERYMSPLPRPVQSDRRHVPGLTDPPCWVTQGESLNCMRVGSVPPYPPLVDLTVIPERLSEEEAAAVTALEGEADGEQESRLGERVPIDLTEDD